MSSEISNIFDKEFDSYGEAVDKYLEYKELTPKWLAQNIIRRFDLTKPKLESLQSMISRWAKGDDVSQKYQARINNVLDITINQNNSGKWNISRTNDEINHSNEPRVQYADSVELPESGQLSKDQMKKLLGQIELIARILKDSLQ